MFNGIIYNQGTIVEILRKKNGINIFLKSNIKISKKNIGISISCDGVCLTLISLKNKISEFYLSKETLKRSNFKNTKVGKFINIEKALHYGKKISGHYIQGHVDTTAKVKSIKIIDKSWITTFSLEKKHKKLIVEKGSISINGVSLTVSKLQTTSFQVTIIPHTLKLTNLIKLKVNDIVNIEFDMIGKYLNKINS